MYLKHFKNWRTIVAKFDSYRLYIVLYLIICRKLTYLHNLSQHYLYINQFVKKNTHLIYQFTGSHRVMFTLFDAVFLHPLRLHSIHLCLRGIDCPNSLCV